MVWSELLSSNRRDQQGAAVLHSLNEATYFLKRLNSFGRQSPGLHRDFVALMH